MRRSPIAWSLASPNSIRITPRIAALWPSLQLRSAFDGVSIFILFRRPRLRFGATRVRPLGFLSSSHGRFLLPSAWHFNRSPARKTDRVVVLTELRTRETHNLSRLGERDDSP